MDKQPTSSKKVAGLVLNVHREPALGMLESVYEYSFVSELTEDGIPHRPQASMPTGRSTARKQCRNYKVDLFINDKMIVELKGIV